MKQNKVVIYGSFQPLSIPCGITQSVNNLLNTSLTDNFEIEIISTARTNNFNRTLLQRLAHGIWLALTTAKKIILSRSDIVDVHAVSGRDFLKNSAVVVIAKLLGRPTILRIHGGNFDSAFAKASSKEQKLIRVLLRLSNRVVVLSRHWQDIVLQIEPKTKTVIIPNSIDCSALGAIHAKRPRSNDNILLLGNLCHRKGHFDALHVAVKVSQVFPKAKFLFAGAERDKGALRQLKIKAKELGVIKNVEFLGPVFGDAKDELLLRAGIFLMPSHVENMPISLMEAMAAGLPAIATCVGAVPEMVQEGVTGYVVECRNIFNLADRLSLLLADPTLREDLGHAACKTARSRWDSSFVAKQVQNLYEELL